MTDVDPMIHLCVPQFLLFLQLPFTEDTTLPFYLHFPNEIEATLELKKFLEISWEMLV
jgi:hypothetical protein